MYADKEQKKVGIFDRLEQTKKKSAQPHIKVTGISNVPSTSATSIFSRLGGKSDDIELDDDKAVAFAGILKSAPKKVGFLNTLNIRVAKLYTIVHKNKHIYLLYEEFYKKLMNKFPSNRL